MSIKPLKPKNFYGHSLDGICDELEKKIEKAKKQRPADPYYLKPRSILQPIYYKQEFWKQNDALMDAADHSRDEDILCCFVFQDENEHRRFIVMYPEDFWEEVEQAPLEKRVFYEVIPIFAPCFLYYDLEFETDLNTEKNGVKMTQTLIDITCEYINKQWGYSCNRSMVINLDSSRPGKFSKHLIFSTNGFAFENNLHVGHLVKLICSELTSYCSSENENHDIYDKFNKSDLEELFVETSKGKKLFVDSCVYTKNRHFRIYKATKFGKNSHLNHSPDCEFKFTQKVKNKDLNIFICSLVSYLPRKLKMKLLRFDENKKSEVINYSQHSKPCLMTTLLDCPKSPYPELDKYISNYVKPGKVRDTKFIENKKYIIFEIVGNRYCENIGRQHKSNNIYLAVDLINKVMYQKCHDEDCAAFVSVPKKLPSKVTFYFDDESDLILSDI